MKHFFLFALATSLAGLFSCKKSKIETPQAVSLTELSRHAERVVQKHNLAGMSIALVKKDSLLWTGHFGQAVIETQTPVTNVTVFKAASLAKPITALVVLKLVEEGLLDLDRDINTYLPFRLEHPAFPNEKITTQQLLTHTSGISDAHYATLLESDFAMPDADHPMPLSYFCTEMLRKGGAYYSSKSFSANKPGTVYEYSNLGVSLAAWLVEVIKGQSFEAYSKSVLFNPLALQNTTWHLNDIPAAQVAMLYNKQRQPYGLYTTVDFPSGGLFTTAAEASKLLRLIMNNGLVNGRQLIRADLIREMKKAQYPGVAKGDLAGHGLLLERSQPGYYKLLGHNGQAPGVNALMWYNEEKETGAVLLLNRDYGTSECLEDIINLLDKTLHAGVHTDL